MKPDWLPNWRNSSEYPDPNKTDFHQWAWEFLRRNPEYQRAYYRMARKNTLVELHNTGNDVSSEEESFVIENMFAFSRIMCEFGTSKDYLPPDPSDDAAYKSAFSGRYDLPYNVHNPVAGFEDGLLVRSISQDIIEEPREGEILVLFNAHQPIENQLDAARDILLREIGKQSNPRKSDKYTTYLRILDADTCGVGNTEIAKTLYPNLPNIYPEYRANKTLSDDRRVAQGLRDHGYRTKLLRMVSLPK